MSSTYAGNPANYPDTITLPSDGDASTAASVTVPMEGNADRGAWLRAEAGMLGINFASPVTITGTPTIRYALYNTASRVWWVFADDKDVRSSTDGCVTWSGSNVNTATGTTDCRMADVDANGALVITLDATSDLLLFDGSMTWSDNTNIGTLTMLTTPQIVYSPVAARWCFAGYQNSGSGVLKVYTSSNRTTWSAATTTPWPSVGASPNVRLGVNRTSGRIVAFRYDAMSSHQYYFLTSDDGGQTWTLRASKDQLSSQSWDTFSVKYNQDRAEWVAISSVAASSKTEVWVSTDDGVTWTNAAALTTASLISVAAVRGGWVATTYAGELVYATQGASTWRYAGYVVGDAVFGSRGYGHVLSTKTSGKTRFGIMTGIGGTVLT